MTHPALPWLVPLQQCAQASPALVGNKAANLGRLKANRFPVPDGFVVTTAVHALAADGVMPAEARAVVELAYAELTGPAKMRTVVRSSAPTEDSPDATFAGIYASYYDVDAERLIKRIEACWASMRSSVARAYQRQHREAQASAMAVIVQEQIDARAAGVAFTVNPATGADEIVIESVLGKGSVLVEGRADPDRYVLGKPDLRVLSRRIGRKEVQIPAAPATHGEPIPVAVSSDERARDSLSDEELRRIGKWALQAERLLGQPQDLEWAADGGGVHILQARPVTACAPLLGPALDGGPYVRFKPAMENFTEPLTPLSADLLASVPLPGGRIIKGWVYWDVAFLRPWIPFDLSDRELYELLSLSAPADRRYRLAWRKLPLLAVLLVIAYVLFAVTLARSRRAPDELMECFRDRVEACARDAAVTAEAAARRIFLPGRLLEPIGCQPLLINLSTARLLPYLVLLRFCLKRWTSESSAETLAALTSGAVGVRSAEMGRDIARLAEIARHSAFTRQLLEATRPELASERLRAEPQARGFVEALERFLETYGHRAPRELELAAPRFHEDPQPVLAAVKSHLQRGDTDRQFSARSLRARAAASVAGLSLPKRLFVRYLAARARYFGKLRENSRFYHILGFDLLRNKTLARAENLVQQGLLRARDDVFFLHMEELDALDGGALGAEEAARRVRRRRVEHTRLARLGPVPAWGLALGEVERAERHALRGQGASPGIWEGPARVLFTPTDAVHLAPGEVLVAPYTDPAWTPLFLVAGAAVVETGSYLSHAGAVAREYGMPCVVDVDACTSRIRTGDRIRVDGSSGEVCILSSREGG